MKKTEQNAFPALHLDAHQGMSLRDYFAAKVLQGISSLDDKGTFNNIEEALEGQAKYCYKAADAMLKQRDL